MAMFPMVASFVAGVFVGLAASVQILWSLYKGLAKRPPG